MTQALKYEILPYWRTPMKLSLREMATRMADTTLKSYDGSYGVLTDWDLTDEEIDEVYAITMKAIADININRRQDNE